MQKGFGAFIIGVSLSLAVQGCVSADAYRMKEEEVLSLYSVNEDMQQRNETLRADKAGLEMQLVELQKENEDFEFRIDKQNKQIAFLKSWGETLEKDGDDLRARMEKMNTRIAELDKDNQRLVLLTRPENLLLSLGDRLADLQMRVEALSGENEDLRSRQAFLKSDEKRAIGGGIGQTPGSRSGEPQTVAVSSGQIAEGGESHKQ